MTLLSRQITLLVRKRRTRRSYIEAVIVAAINPTIALLNEVEEDITVILVIEVAKLAPIEYYITGEGFSFSDLQESTSLAAKIKPVFLETNY